jgi:hypothetical protein
MLRLPWVPSLVLAALLTSMLGRAQAPDAGATLLAARQALGGDAALRAVTSLTITGSVNTDVGPAVFDSDLEIDCVLPDKFVRITRRTMSRGPMGTFDMTERRGFNGSDPIQETIAPDAPFPVVIPAGPAPATPDEIAAARARQANNHKHTFTELSLSLFAASFAAYPLELTAAGPMTTSDGTADAIDVKGPDGMAWTMLLDAASHLPARIVWMAKPIVTASRSSTMMVGPRGQMIGSSGGGATSLPAGDPTVGLASVEWQLTLSDYRTEGGLNWPHRMTTTIDGRTYEKTRLSRFKINPAIKPSTFAPSK